MKSKIPKSLMKELQSENFYKGYTQGIEDALKTIQSILRHNNVNMQTKEFWIEYNHLKEEGKIK